MIGTGVMLRTVEVEKIQISECELAARIGCYCSASVGGMADVVSEILAHATPKYCYVRLPVSYPRPGVLSIGECEVVSASLLKNLNGARSVVVMCVTLGNEVDRYLRRTAVRSAAQHFLADGAASAAAEALCEYADEQIRAEAVGETLLRRFSPGYGDLSLDVQPYILQKLSVGSLLGVALTEEYLMIPTKTITAIIGIKND